MTAADSARTTFRHIGEGRGRQVGVDLSSNDSARDRAGSAEADDLFDARGRKPSGRLLPLRHHQPRAFRKVIIIPP
jgi:hypothetical protein